MKKHLNWILPAGSIALWAIFALSFAVRRTSATTSAITGNIFDAQGNPVNGTLTMQLPVAAQDTATNTAIAPTLVSYRIVNGAIQSGPPLYDVAGLQPKNLFYVAKVFDSAGNLILNGNYVVTGGSFNLGAATPTTVTTSNISYVTPVTTSASNVFTATQAFPTIASSASPISSAGFERMANTDALGWRNSNNTVNLLMVPGFVNAIDTLTVNGINLSASLVEPGVNQGITFSAGPASVGAGQVATLSGTAAQGVTNGSGGNTVLATGAGLGTGSSGDVVVAPGAAGASGSSGNLVLTGRTFANLGTPPGGNGSIIFCTDCTIANPCAGAGTGALAKRLNGAWVCN